jgi:ribosomal-protein-alanine N-acetyltransferase
MLPNSPPVLFSDRVVLRPVRESDREERLALGRDPEFHRLVGGDPARSRLPLTRADVERWYRRLAAEPVSWAIEHQHRLVGTASLHPIDLQHRRARYSIGIFTPRDRGHGLGTEATRCVLGFAFRTLELHRVDLRVLDFNTQAITVYERCGFVREGVEREGALIGGRWCSDVVMSILEQEYATPPA